MSYPAAAPLCNGLRADAPFLPVEMAMSHVALSTQKSWVAQTAASTADACADSVALSVLDALLLVLVGRSNANTFCCYVEAATGYARRNRYA